MAKRYRGENNNKESNGAWEIKNKWNNTYIKKYQEYAKKFGSSEFHNPTKVYDCGDYGFELLINFAAQNNLSLKFKYYVNGKMKTFNAGTRGFSSKEGFLSKVKVNLGAVQIIDNSVKISIENTTAGNLLMTKPDNVPGTTGHTRIVYYNIKQKNGDYLLQWLQAPQPAGPIRGYQKFYSEFLIEKDAIW